MLCLTNQLIKESRQRSANRVQETLSVCSEIVFGVGKSSQGIANLSTERPNLRRQTEKLSKKDDTELRSQIA